VISQLRDLDIHGASRAFYHRQEAHPVRAGHGGPNMLVRPSNSVSLLGMGSCRRCY
jgi:hypothetical protein